MARAIQLLYWRCCLVVNGVDGRKKEGAKLEYNGIEKIENKKLVGGQPKHAEANNIYLPY